MEAKGRRARPQPLPSPPSSPAPPAAPPASAPRLAPARSIELRFVAPGAAPSAADKTRLRSPPRLSEAAVFGGLPRAGSGSPPASPAQGALRLTALRHVFGAAPVLSEAKAEEVKQPVAVAGESEELDAASAARLSVGEDAIAYFLRHGSSTALKFVFCNRARSDEYRPYDLVVVRRKDVAAEHFTISATGVVHVRPGEASECTSLADWVHESSCFSLLRNIGFFRHYLVAKTFRLWRSNVRFAVFCAKRRRVASRLFVARRSFAAPLLQAHALLHDVRNVRLLAVRAQVVQTSVFVQEQAEQRSAAGKGFSESVERLEALLEAVCRRIKDNVRQCDQELAEANHAGFARHLAAGIAKARSMVAVKQERLAKQRRLRAAQDEVAMLSDFIRLADYMQVEALVHVASATAARLLSALQTRKQPLFKTSVGFASAGLSFSPDAATVLAAVGGVMDELVVCVAAVDRVLFLPSLRGCVQGSVSDGPQVDRVLARLAAFQRARAAIERKLETDFASAAETVGALERFRPVHSFGRQWSADAYRAQSGHSAQSLRRDMDQQREWAEDIERNIRHTYDAGVLQVESRELKEALLPVTATALAGMREVLLRTFRDHCAELRAAYTQRMRVLEEDPRELRAYALHVERFNETRHEAEALAARAKEIDAMHAMLAQHGIRIAAADAVCYDDVRAAGRAFAEALTATEGRIDDRMMAMRQTVYKSLSQLSEQLRLEREALLRGALVDPHCEPAAALRELAAARARVEEVRQQAVTLQGYQVLFGIEPFNFSALPETQKVLERLARLWGTFASFCDAAARWSGEDLRSLDVEAMSAELAGFHKEALRLQRESPPELEAAAARYRDLVQDWRPLMPAILELGSKAMRPQHWQRLFSELSLPYYPHETLRLRRLRELGLFSRRELISDVAEQAVGEFAIETALTKIRKGWEAAEFVVVPLPAPTTSSASPSPPEAFVLGDVENLTALLEESQATLHALLGSRFVQPVRREVDEWLERLARLSDVLDEWLRCQRAWLYLEPVFASPDMAQQLPAEARAFAETDRFFRDTMRRVHAQRNVLRALAQPQLLSGFGAANAALERAHRSLQDFFEAKRAAFPRFCFLADEELLQVLAQTRDPRAVQPHVRKVFDGVARLVFSPAADAVAALRSAEGEELPLGTRVAVAGGAEQWLAGVERAMRVAVELAAAECLRDAAAPQGGLAAWLHRFPAQAALLAQQVLWTSEAHAALRAAADGDRRALAALGDASRRRIGELVELARAPLDRLRSAAVASLIVLAVHGRDVAAQLDAAGCASLEDFEWTRHMRFSYEADAFVVRQATASFRYGCEFLGTAQRLVLTPLTDRAHLTLTSALALHYGGAPQGPAGTGKTETVKDLARALGVPLVVFNCSEGVDAQMMARFFAGLAQSGGWACLDEFNRLDVEVLSVVAQQLLTLQTATRARRPRVELGSRSLPLQRGWAFFATMNPGYAGRAELPDNLKALLRPVAMAAPDSARVAETLLCAEGFRAASELAARAVQLFRLAAEQLSGQSHYDFGLRALKAALLLAGRLRRADAQQTTAPTAAREEALLVRALCDSNLPKLTAADTQLFRALLSDLFPGCEAAAASADSTRVVAALEAQLAACGLQRTPALLEKAAQLHDALAARHGVMLVGAAASGKSAALELLARALPQLVGGAPLSRVTLNPKALSVGELYGHAGGESAAAAGEWSDGLVAHAVRRMAEEAAGARSWLVFDGPVDPQWVENLNTALDDSRTLCLASGERIRLPQGASLLFEVDDLAAATPTTVSRCAMVYFEPAALPTDALVDAWAAQARTRLPPQSVQLLVRRLKRHLRPALAFLRAECRLALDTPDAALVQQSLALLDALLVAERGFDAAVLGEDELQQAAQMTLAFALTWALGGALVDESRAHFSAFLRSELADMAASLPPPQDTLYDWGLSIAPGALAFEPWRARVPAFAYDPAAPLSARVLVPTVDSVRASTLLELLVGARRSVLLAGPSGTGKTALLSQLLTAASRADGSGRLVVLSATLSAQTSAQQLQELLESKLERKRKTLLGAPVGKRAVLFLDDLNLPRRERFGAQPPLELVRQVLEREGIYDRQRLFWKRLQDVQVAATCAPPGGGRNRVSARVTRHLHVLWQPQLSEQTLRSIFAPLLSGFLAHLAGSPSALLARLGAPLADAAVSLFLHVRDTLLPTPAKAHYSFNLRDLAKVFQGLLLASRPSLPAPDALLRLWLHETARVFRDRLVDADDRRLFDAAAFNALRGAAAGLVELHQVRGADGRALAAESVGALLFAESFVLPGASSEAAEQPPSPYCEVAEPAKLQALLGDALVEYNAQYAQQLQLVFFPDAVQHLLRIARVLRQPRGHALLVGVGGSGRQSLTRLAAYLCRQAFATLEQARGGVGRAEWREALRAVLLTAGVEGRGVVFFLSDTNALDEGCLEDINSLVNSGDVPALFAPEQQEQIAEALRPALRAAGHHESRDAALALFQAQVLNHLHVVLALSPAEESFRERCRQYPSLVSCCAIDWYAPWPPEALQSVAERVLASEPDLALGEHLQALASVCVRVAQAVERVAAASLSELRRRIHVPPAAYLEHLRLFLALLREQRERVARDLERYTSGLSRLQETNQEVARLKDELIRMQPRLAQAVEEAAQLVTGIDREQKEAEESRDRCQQDAAQCEATTARVAAIRDECQRELAEALPAYEAAVAALDTVKKEHISVLKSFANPPQGVQKVMQAVCLLFSRKPSWEEAKRLLALPRFLDMCKDFDKDNVPPRILKKLQDFIADPEFSPQALESVSQAAVSLCLWVRAIDTYARVAKLVEPKREALGKAEAELASTSALLASKQAHLQEVEGRVSALRARYDAKVRERDQLRAAEQLTRSRLERAERLVSGLAAEELRWTQLAAALAERKQHLHTHALLGAAALAYLGPFAAQHRQTLLAEWRSVAAQHGFGGAGSFALSEALGDPVALRDWSAMGLPADAHSIENALLVTRSRRWPLLVDPQGQGVRWLRQLGRADKMLVARASDANVLRVLEQGVRLGQPVLLEDVGERLDPTLAPLIQRQVFRKGVERVVRIGDAEVPYAPEFRLYLATRLAEPRLGPDIFAQLSVVNFGVTPQGLEEQLLQVVSGLERADLAERHAALVTQLADDRRQLEAVEAEVLRLLASSAGAVLDDEGLVAALQTSKDTAAAILARVAEAQNTLAEIAAVCEQYRAVARRGAVLSFTLVELARVDAMCQFSFFYLGALFARVVRDAAPAATLAARLATIKTDLIAAVHRVGSRALAGSHRTLFALLLAAAAARQEGRVSEAEWALFVAGADGTQPQGAADGDEEIGPGRVGALAAAEALPGWPVPLLSGPFGLGEAREMWRAFCSETRAPPPATGVLEPAMLQQLSPFQQLLLVRLLRPDALPAAARRFAACELGAQASEARGGGGGELAQALEETSAFVPLVLVLAPGADPLPQLVRVARQRQLVPEEGTAAGGAWRLHVLSLGQGQGAAARKLLERARAAGDWVCLQNCHLAASWLAELERLLEEAAAAGPEHTHAGFRLVLTTAPSQAFPSAILQNAVKLSCEPPQGVRANVLHALGELSDADVAMPPSAGAAAAEHARLLLSLTALHAALLERRRFAARGFSQPYAWGDADLELARRQLRALLADGGARGVPWRAVAELVGELGYAGRVTDERDRRCVRALLRRFLSPHAFADALPTTGARLAHLTEAALRLPAFDDETALLGLGADAALGLRRHAGSELLADLALAEPRAARAAAARRDDDVVLETAAAILSRLPQPLSRAEAQTAAAEAAAGARAAGSAEAGGNVLGSLAVREAARFNRLLSLVGASLSDLMKALRGTLALTAELEALHAALLRGRVPAAWAAAAYPSLKPLGAWLCDLAQRVEALRQWLAAGAPAVFWLGGFAVPQGLLSAVLQRHARTLRVSVDSLRLRAHVLAPDAAPTTPPDAGVFVRGLLLQGAAWDAARGALVEAAPHQLLSALPVVWLEPVPASKLAAAGDASLVECPVYRTGARGGDAAAAANLVCELALPSTLPADHCAQRGVAIFTQSDE